MKLYYFIFFNLLILSCQKNDKRTRTIYKTFDFEYDDRPNNGVILDSVVSDTKKLIYNYDSDLNLISSFKYEKKLNHLIPSSFGTSKREYFYDTSGKLVSTILYEYLFSKKQFIPFSKSERQYENGKLIRFIKKGYCLEFCEEEDLDKNGFYTVGKEEYSHKKNEIIIKHFGHETPERGGVKGSMKYYTIPYQTIKKKFNEKGELVLEISDGVTCENCNTDYQYSYFGDDSLKVKRSLDSTFCFIDTYDKNNNLISNELYIKNEITNLNYCTTKENRKVIDESNSYIVYLFREMSYDINFNKFNVVKEYKEYYTKL
jgi:hypothetical protein